MYAVRSRLRLSASCSAVTVWTLAGTRSRGRCDPCSGVVAVTTVSLAPGSGGGALSVGNGGGAACATPAASANATPIARKLGRGATPHFSPSPRGPSSGNPAPSDEIGRSRGVKCSHA